MDKIVEHRLQKGFTLFELLVVIATITILVGIVIIAINPSKNLADSRNAQRSSDVTTILDSVYQYSIDNSGTIPSTIATTAIEICATGATTCTGLTDLSTVTASEKYVIAMPKDPQCSTTCAANGTGYKILKDANGRITVSAPAAENGKAISVTR